MISGLNWSNDLSEWSRYRPADPLRKLVADIHIYNYTPCNNSICRNKTIIPILETNPVIIGEYGENDCSVNFVKSLLAWSKKHNINGLISWGWNPTYAKCTTDGLIKNWHGNTTQLGQFIKSQQ